MKTKLLSILGSLALAVAALAQTTTLTINNSTGLVNVPAGLVPYFATVGITGALTTPQQYGAIADGTSHPVSEWLTTGVHSRGYADLNAIIADYPEVTSSGDECDWAATQRAVNHNKTVFMPSVSGGYVFNKPLVTVDDGQQIIGGGRQGPYGTSTGARILVGPGIDGIRVVNHACSIRDLSVTGTTVGIHSITGNPAVLTTSSAHGLPTASIAITGNTAAAPTVVATSAAHGLTNADWIKISGSSGGVIDGFWRVIVTDATHFKLIDTAQAEVSAGSNGGACAFVRVYEVTVGPAYGSGQPVKTSGTLTSGQQYQIVHFVAGDDFTNIGAGSNAKGVVFTASGTTPTTWTHGSSVTPAPEVLGMYHAIPATSTTLTLYTTANATWNQVTPPSNDTGVLYVTRRAISFGDDGAIDNALNSPDPGHSYFIQNLRAEKACVGVYLGNSDAGGGGNMVIQDCGIGLWADGNLDRPCIISPWVTDCIVNAYRVTRNGGLFISGGGGANNASPIFLGADLAGVGSDGNYFGGYNLYFEGHQRDQFPSTAFNYYAEAGVDNTLVLDGLLVQDSGETPCHFHGGSGKITVRNSHSISTQLIAYSTGSNNFVFGDAQSSVRVNLYGSKALTFDYLQYIAGDFFAQGSQTALPSASNTAIGTKYLILNEPGGSVTPGMHIDINVTGSPEWRRYTGSLAGLDSVTESNLSLSDVTTANASTTKHGFVPKLPNDATKYLDGSGAFSVPAGSGGGGAGTTYAATLSSHLNNLGGTGTTFTNVTDLTINPSGGVPVGKYAVMVEGGVGEGTGDDGFKWDLNGGTAVFASLPANSRYQRAVGWDASGGIVNVKTGDTGSTSGAIYDGENWTTLNGDFAFRYGGVIEVTTAGSIIFRVAHSTGSAGSGGGGDLDAYTHITLIKQ